jgi:diguanylate cyclase (GGDEF)-like protein/PAS domain S-box-containing protein
MKIMAVPRFIVPRRISTKLILVLMPLVLAFSLLIVLLGPRYFRIQAIRDLEDKSLGIAEITAYSLAPALYLNDRPTIDEVISNARKNTDLDYLVISDSTNKPTASYGLEAAVRSRYLEIERAGISADGLVYGVKVPVIYNDRKLGDLHLGFSMKRVYEFIGNLKRTLALVGLAFFVIGLAAVFLISNAITGPLRRMAQTAGRIVEGDLTRRADVSSRDETGELARSFNTMVDHLETARRTLEQRVEERTRELKTVADALRESEELFRSIVESMGEGVGIVGPDEKFVFANAAANAIFGLSEGRLIGLGLDEFMTAEQFALMQEQTRARRRGQKAAYEVEIKSADGKSRTLHVSAITRFDRDGTFIGTLGVFSDVSERKWTETSLREANERLRLSVKELEARTAEMTLLSELYDSFQSCKNEDEIYKYTAQFARKLFPETGGVLFIFNASRNMLETVARWGEAAPAQDFIVEDDCWGLRRGKAYVMDNPSAQLICRHVEQSGRTPSVTICEPLVSGGQMMGLLYLEGLSAAPVSKADSARRLKVQLTASFRERISLALSNLRLSEKLLQQSIRDPLTNLFNRRYMEETLEREIFRTTRAQLPLGIIMIDIDHFKSFNDSYGHEAGDAMLKAIAAFLQDQVRKEDVACRFGGEEFTLIMPGAGLPIVLSRAQILLEKARLIHVPFAGRTLGPVTLSLGVAMFPEQGRTGGLVIHAADEALLKAKRSGRNRVVVSDR